MTLSNRFRSAVMLALFGGWSAQAVSQPDDVVIRPGGFTTGLALVPMSVILQSVEIAFRM